ncbi:phage fiber-tail adaptor protein [Shinella pollutisoli]|uniref:Uncharacterized protein n=1 Tax=Shinella pollutisoli TaxID=2250594 RepID=A0ABV7DK83_9HYPH|nr:hypothetical protein [Shinella pollutisoli]
MTDVMQKAPADELDYDIDFSRWLKGSDRIIDAETTIAGETSVSVVRTDFADRSVRVWLSGGMAGENGLISVLATTVEDRKKEFCFVIKVRDCC